MGPDLRFCRPEVWAAVLVRRRREARRPEREYGTAPAEGRAAEAGADRAAEVEGGLVEGDGDRATAFPARCEEVVQLGDLERPADRAPDRDGDQREQRGDGGGDPEGEQREGEDRQDADDQGGGPADLVHEGSDEDAAQHAADAPGPEVRGDVVDASRRAGGHDRDEVRVEAEAGDGGYNSLRLEELEARFPGLLEQLLGFVVKRGYTSADARPRD
ncbi:hypothetical protein ACIQ1J_13560 [Streptomyces sp. NPDC097107]|uniref:hypothetical protein n=1 Tax=Streptomyces sp. NPDC097107 TaxID=3366089 RepID=UPI00381A9365